MAGRSGQRAPKEYEQGDQVYYWEDLSVTIPQADRLNMVRLPHKLKFRWSGPFEVTKKSSCGNNVFIKQLTNTEKC